MELSQTHPLVTSAEPQSPSRPLHRFAISTIWMLFLLSACIPINATFLSYGVEYTYSWGANLSYYGAPQIPFIIAAPFVALGVGAILLFRTLPNKTFLGAFRNSHLAVVLVAGEAALLRAIFHPHKLDLPIVFPDLLTWSLSATEVIWFHGLLIEKLKQRPILGTVTTSVLLAAWHVSFECRRSGFGLDTDYGLWIAALYAFAAVPFSIARYRGASILSLIVAHATLSSILDVFNRNGNLITRDGMGEILLVTGCYFLLLLLIWILPASRSQRPEFRRRQVLSSGAVALALVAATIRMPLTASQSANKPSTHAEKWAQDLEFLARVYPKKHIDFGRLMDVQAFRSAIYEIKAAAPTLSDAQIVFKLSEVLARLHVGHSRVVAPQRTIYPLEFEWLSDGLGVTLLDGAAENTQKVLKVLRIGTIAPDQVERMLAPYLASENSIWLHELVPLYALTSPWLMGQLGISIRDGKLPLLCEDVHGLQHQLMIAPGPQLQNASSSIASVRAQIDSTIAPELLEKAKGYWGGILSRYPNTLYIRYDECHDREGNPFGTFSQFSHAMLELADKRAATDVLIDVRFNTGGAYDTIAPLLRGLKKRSALAKNGKIRVLISGQTFSAAVINAAALKSELGAVLMGEPTGGELTFYANSASLYLPNKRLEVLYSTRKVCAYFGARGSLFPDISLQRRSFSDLCAGRDPQIDIAAQLGSPATGQSRMTKSEQP